MLKGINWIWFVTAPLFIIMYAIVGNALLCNSPINVTCLFFHTGIFNVSSDSLWWVLFSTSVYHLDLLLSVITLVGTYIRRVNSDSFVPYVNFTLFHFAHAYTYILS